MNPAIPMNLKDEIKRAITSHYKTLNANFPEGNFYGYSLYTSDDVSSIDPVANRESSISVDKDDPSYNYYRYSPDEWSDWDDYGKFDYVNLIIKKFGQLKSAILQQAFQALIELESEGLFGIKSDSRFIVIWLSDSDNEIIHISAKQLNSEKVYLEFASEFMTE
ncbi:MAG TPA: DUF4303 domain-containing protein [Patescibacteria group bacterium]